MPLRCPAGALPEAFRVICMRGVRALGRGAVGIDYAFPSESSAKCAYCTQQKEKCRPVPVYVKEEFDKLQEVLEDLEDCRGSGGPEEEQAALEASLKAAARALGLKVQVTKVQEKEQSAAAILAESHQVLTDIKSILVRLEESVAEIAAAAVRSRTPAGQAGKKGKKEKKDKKRKRPVEDEARRSRSPSGSVDFDLSRERSVMSDTPIEE